MKIVSSREFNQDISAAKRAAEIEPVLVTDRGRPSHVLMSHAQFERLWEKGGPSVIDILNDPSPDADFDFEPERLDWIPRHLDLD